MKIAIALRTCDSVLSYWGSKRFVECYKPELILTCLTSLLKSIVYDTLFRDDEYVISVHDDCSSNETLLAIQSLFEYYTKPYKIPTVEIINSGNLNNFKTQYEWVKTQDCDYVYCVEDDYLHKIDCIREMRTVVLDMKSFLQGEYAVHPFNNPHRYASFEMLYPSYIIKGRTQYWRSSFHSTHTFFISKQAFEEYDAIMKLQAYAFPNCTEDESINKIWREQKVRLLTPLDSLALHLADKSQEDTFSEWQSCWEQNHYEIR